MKQKVLLLCILLALGALGNFTPQVQASFVTETSDYILVENDYFIANISKGWHGKIRNFYIKPQNTIDIVAWAAQWNFLGGHENPTSWNGTDLTAVDWGSSTYKESQTTEIVYQTATVAVIKSITHYKETGSYLHLTTEDDYAFYSDKPYYLVSISRTYHEEVKKNYNYQYCWLLNNTWANTYYRINHNNTIETITGITEEDSIGVWESQYLQKYPWAMLYNTTYSKGFFSILLSANPHTASLGMLGTAASQYKEFQIHWSMDYAASGTTFYASYLAGVASTTAYVDDLASSLWSSDVIQADNDRLEGVSSNPAIETDQRKNRITSTTTPPLSYFHSGLIYLGHDNSEQENGVFIGDEDNVLNEWQFVYRYANATNEYSLWTSSGSTIDQTAYFHNGTYTNVTLQRQFEDKFSVKLVEERWADSDSWYQTYQFSLLKDATVSYLWAYYRISEPQAQFSMTELTADEVVKVNMSTYYVSGMNDDGVVFKKISGNLSRIEAERYATYSFLKIYAKYGGGATAYTAGTSWTIKMLVQKFRRYTSQGLGYFGLTDIKTPEEHESEILTYHHRLSWAKFPLETDSPYRIAHYGKGFLITEATRAPEELNFRVVDNTAESNTIQIYLGNRNLGSQEPKTVEGVNSWSYDPDTFMLTLTTLPETDVFVKINFGSGDSSGKYSVVITVSTNYLPVYGASVVINGENKTTDLLGRTIWELTFGDYTIWAYCQGKNQSQNVSINQDRTLGFNFTTTPEEQPPPNFMAIIITAVVLVIGFIFLSARRRK